jgi:hypothetical protein
MRKEETYDQGNIGGEDIDRQEVFLLRFTEFADQRGTILNPRSSYAGRSRCDGKALRHSSSAFETSISKSVWPERMKLKFGPPVSPIVEHAAPA